MTMPTTLHGRLTAALAAAPVAAVEDEAHFGPAEADRVAAAVLIAFTDRPEPGVLLTQRPQWLRAHAGQVAFPGGKVDPDDADIVATALREAEEELGIAPRDVAIVGTADPFLSGSGFRITPVLGVVPADIALDPNPDEVDAWFEVPAATLFDAAAYAQQTSWWRGANRSFHELYWQDRRIWGVTAGIILNLARRFDFTRALA